MKYIYGPVNSRRLGFSLGLSLTPHKVCNFDCVYCQLGRTNNKVFQRKAYVKSEDILGELKLWLQNNLQAAKTLNYITIAGSGEPTLNIEIGLIIAGIKKLTNIPVAIITNASLFNDKNVRQELLNADLIVPSLDAAIPKIFMQVNRPAQGIKIEDIIAGLIAFRKEFPGKIWLEVMLVRGINDNLEEIKKLKEIVDKIRPDKIQLNSPVRATAEPNMLPVDNKKLNEIKEILNSNCEVI
jgi:wyosine [tRNA(Phe)-imidazoG37] synthetase (radical SAM superfamily)